MARMQPEGSKDEIAAALLEQAARLWGRERAGAIRAALEQTADHLWQVSQNLPDREEEPAFFL